MKKTTTEDWFPDYLGIDIDDELIYLLKQLGDSSEGFGLSRTFPPPEEKLSLMSIVDHWDKERAREIIDRWSDFRVAHVAFPLVAVTGTLNSGKSTLCQQFLKKRDFVLSGLENNSGSHRFTFWLPSSWEKEDFFTKIKTDNDPFFSPDSFEELSDNPEEARKQQNERGKVDRPLLAFDEHLDIWNLALVDCPDVESGKEGSPGVDPARKEALRTLARLCKHVIFVQQHGEENKDLCHEILDIFSNKIGKVMVINKARYQSERDAPECIVESALQSGLLKGIDHLYLAYRYDLKNYHKNVVPVIEKYLKTSYLSDGDDLPAFFQASFGASTPPPDSCWIQYLIENITKTTGVDVDLQRHRFLKAVDKLTHITWSKKIEVKNAEYTKIKSSLDDRLNKAFSAKKRNLDRRLSHKTFFPSAKDVDCFVSSVERTMPWDIKQMYRGKEKISKALDHPKVRNAFAKIKIFNKFIKGNKSVDEIYEVIDKQRESAHKIPLFTVSDFESWANKMNLPSHQWENVIVEIQGVYNNNAYENLKTDEEWDVQTEEMWKNITPSQRLKIYATTAAPFLASLAVFDGGISLVVALSAGAGVTAATGAIALFKFLPDEKQESFFNEMFNHHKKLYTQALYNVLGFDDAASNSYLRKLNLVVYDEKALVNTLKKVADQTRDLLHITT